MDGSNPAGGMAYADLWRNVGDAHHLMRTLGNEIRLTIVCLLGQKERSVSDIEVMTGARQPTVSQQLARLRADGVVEARRVGRTVYYSLACPRTRQILDLLDSQYGRCAVSLSGASPGTGEAA